MCGHKRENEAAGGCCDGKCSCDWDACRKAMEECCNESGCSCDCEEMNQKCCTAE